MEPLPDAEQAKEFIATKLQPTLVKGLTALCKEKPTAGKMEAITWLSNWLMENNPYTAQTYSAGDLPLPAVMDDEDEEGPTTLEEDIDELEAAQAATKLQAHFRGFQARKNVSGMKASTGGTDAGMVVIESHTAASDDAEENAAATKLQANFKGHMGRKKVAAIKKEKEEEKEMAHAATKVQAGFRGHQARKEVANKKAGAAAAPAEAAPAEPAPAAE